MRVIAGTARGRKLATVPGDTTRPIADRVQEAVAPREVQVPVLAKPVVDLAAYDRLVGVGR